MTDRGGGTIHADKRGDDYLAGCHNLWAFTLKIIAHELKEQTIDWSRKINVFSGT